MKTSHFLYGAAALFALGGCHKKHEKGTSDLVQEVARSKAKDAQKNLQGLKSSTMEGATLSGGDAQGRPLWKISAARINTNGDLDSGSAKQAILSDANATLYQLGKPETTLKAPQIVVFYTPQGVRLQMSKGVTGRSQGIWTGNHGPIDFAAPRADVDVQKRLLAASGGVTMSQGKLKAQGQTLHAATSLKTADLTGKVHGSGPNGQMDADVATYDWEKSIVTAKKVKASQQGTQITGDNLTGNTDASTGTVTGHVVAVSDQGTANAPQIDFDWKKDHIVANNATFAGRQGGTLRADHLQTDSKLRIASASGLVAEKDGATLRAVSADGFNSLVRIQGKGVSFQRADLTFTAPRADASKKGDKWVLVASGGARGHNASGTVNASQVTWDESNSRVKASGGVTMLKDGATLMASRLDSDTKFESATLTGDVHGKMQDGSTFTSGVLQKRGQSFLASNGTTAHFKTRSEGVLTITAPKLVAAADGSTATASGGVTVKSATGATARAPKAVYDRKTNKVTATGGVDFYDPVRGVRQHGETLVADLNLNEARLSHPSGKGDSDLFKGKNPFKGLGEN